MTTLVILTSQEQRRFNTPPVFTSSERALYFSLSNVEMKMVQELRTPTNKLGFLLQLGYFKANAKFFTAEQFRHPDIEYVAKVLNISLNNINLLTYQKKIPTDHRKRILTLLSWYPFNNNQELKIRETIDWFVQQQSSPRNVFLSIIDYCWQNKIELPSYNVLANNITNAYNQFEQKIINIITNKLTEYHHEKLNTLTGISVNKKQLQRSPLATIKQINQSLRPMDIQETTDVYCIFNIPLKW